MDKIMFMVKYGNKHFFTYTYNREHAKHDAHEWIGGNPEEYTVTPLTDKGDVIAVGFTLYA